jgi:ankyrin repeat protein
MSSDAEMMNAVKAGDANAVKAMLAENPSLVNAMDGEGNSAILIATYWGRQAVADVLMTHAPKMNVFEAAAGGQRSRVKQMIEDNPALIHAWSHDGFTPLHLAVFFGRRDVAELLLAHNPDVNAVARNPMGVTPLHSAAAGSHFEICEVLIARGADVNARQQGGFTPLHSAAQNGNLELVDLLLKHGADPHARTDEGKTARDLATEGGHAGVAARLS